MAAETFQELLSLGAFKGLDATKAGTSVEPGHAVSANNANPTIIEDALTTERGRVLMYDFSAIFIAISVIVPVTPIAGGAPCYIVGGRIPHSPFPIFAAYLYTPGSAPVAIPGAVPFDMAVQFSQVVYTNGGQRFFMSTVGGAGFQFYQWQYPPPAIQTHVTFTPSAVGGNMATGTYYYQFTRMTVMPDGSISETSVDLAWYAAPIPVSVTGPTGSVTITPTGGLTWSGTNADGSTFITQVYRLSSLQPTYLQDGSYTGAGAVVDGASDASIVGQAQLIPQRDQPPTSQGAYGLGSAVYNYGAIAIHKGRIWTFVVVPASATNVEPQVQLWYSNVGRGWEFNQLTQVLLLNADVVGFQSLPVIPSGPVGFTYQDLYGNDPVALAKVGTLLLALSRRQTWAVYGDDPTSFVPRQLFNIGCVSRHAVTPALGGVFWLSENGAYFFDGSSPSYVSEGVRGLLKLSPTSSAVLPKDQIAACGFFANMTWYLAFPTLGYALSYFPITGKWLSSLPYAPADTAASAYIPAHPNQATLFSGNYGNDFNEVVAARFGAPAKVDWLFADPNYDLGNPQTATWNGPLSVSAKPSYEKQYRYLTLHVPPGTLGTAVVTLQVDSKPPVVWSIPDLSTTTRQIKGIGTTATTPGGTASGGVRGFMASLSVSVTGLAGKPAPQIWNVVCWGSMPPDRNLIIPA